MTRKRKCIETIHEAAEKNGPDTCWRWPHGTDSHGYGQVWDGVRVLRAHQASYKYYIGPIPGGVLIDHICGEPSCFNPSHLRPATRKGNAEHRTGPHIHNTSGYRGVSFSKRMGKYHARVTHGGKYIHLGYFETAEAAGAAALAKRTELGFLTGMNDITMGEPK